MTISIKTVLDRGANEKQFVPTRLARKQPEKKPFRVTDENCESQWNEYEVRHAKLFRRYLLAVASGDSRRAAEGSTEYRIAIMGGE